jgi:hypothetical protein
LRNFNVARDPGFLAAFEAFNLARDRIEQLQENAIGANGYVVDCLARGR